MLPSSVTTSVAAVRNVPFIGHGVASAVTHTFPAVAATAFPFGHNHVWCLHLVHILYYVHSL